MARLYRQNKQITDTEVIKLSLKKALKHFTQAVVIFEEKFHYRNVGICHSARARLIREQYNFYNTQTSPETEQLVLLISLLRKEQHYYQLAQDWFQKIDNETQIKKIAKKLRRNETELTTLREQLMNCTST